VGDETTRDCIIIDPSDNAPRLLEVVKSEDWTLREIWITHAHFDHILALRDLKAANHVPARMHPADLPILEALSETVRRFGLSDVPPAPKPEIDLHSGDTLELGAERFEVRHVPGHAPGHVIFINHARQVVFDGDTIFQGSVGRTDLPYGDHATLMEAIQTQILSLPDEYVLLPGHGDQTTIGDEKANNPFVVDWLER
jgi:glyoxylase-like metal-dependent hydrolase (beta-lactamase superfamily II)